MTKRNVQESLLAAMMQPGFYPRVPGEVTHKETHISHLFLAGEFVYKIKKALRFSFLDYSTLAQRRYFLNEELRLNRRLAPSVYLGVLPISLDESGWRLGGRTEPAEYVLVMRRLPERRMLPFLLETGQVTPEIMRELAEALGKFHQQAERVHVAVLGDYGQFIEIARRSGSIQATAIFRLLPGYRAGEGSRAARMRHRCRVLFSLRSALHLGGTETVFGNGLRANGQRQIDAGAGAGGAIGYAGIQLRRGAQRLPESRPNMTFRFSSFSAAPRMKPPKSG